MKTNNKKRVFAALTAGFLAITPVMTAGMSAFVANAASITVTDTDTQTHNYQAYRILTGDVDAADSSKLNNIAIGNAITEGDLIAAINSVLEADALAADAAIDTVADKLTGMSDAQCQKLSKAILDSIIKNSGTPLTRSGNDYSTGDNLANGWYLVVDESETGTGKVDVKSANMLKVVGNATITPKYSLPTLDKKIVEGEQEKVANTAAIGDTINYEIKIKVPDTTGYDTYFYNVVDTLSEGLTYTDNSLSIEIQNNEGEMVELDTTKYGTETTSNEVKVVFKNAAELFKDYKVNDPIVIKYSATLNEKAVVGSEGNPNTAQLVYSNDPNAEANPGEDTPDEPSEDSPIGKTPESVVKTYTAALEVSKVDQAKKPLDGAKFRLESTALNQIRVTSGKKFVEAADGEYWKLNDGTYTTTEPTDADNSYYEDTNKKYNLVNTTEVTLDETNEQYSDVFEVDEDGILKFEGLKPGTYTLTEIEAPDGYTIAAPVTFTIEAALDGEAIAWSVSDDSSVTLDEDNALYKTTVVNRKGATLPETGGIGTKLFYLFGGLMVTGSVVLLVTKKRMSAKES